MTSERDIARIVDWARRHHHTAETIRAYDATDRADVAFEVNMGPPSDLLWRRVCETLADLERWEARSHLRVVRDPTVD